VDTDSSPVQAANAATIAATQNKDRNCLALMLSLSPCG